MKVDNSCSCTHAKNQHGEGVSDNEGACTVKDCTCRSFHLYKEQFTPVMIKHLLVIIVVSLVMISSLAISGYQFDKSFEKEFDGKLVIDEYYLNNLSTLVPERMTGEYVPEEYQGMSELQVAQIILQDNSTEPEWKKSIGATVFVAGLTLSILCLVVSYMQERKREALA